MVRNWIALGGAAISRLDGHLIEYSKSAPFCRAIAETFDGAHPCSLCHIVGKGKASEKKSDMQSPAPKIDIICVARTMTFMSPFNLFEYATRDLRVADIGHSPPVPPPRMTLS